MPASSMVPSPYRRKHPSDRVYSEEEAARWQCTDDSSIPHGVPCRAGQGRRSGSDRTFGSTGAGSEDFEFVMSRVKNREVPPPTPTPVWMPWVSWGLDSNSDPDAPLDQPPPFPDDIFEDDSDQQTSGPKPLKRRTIVFSVSTTKHETVERLGRSNRILMDSADDDDEADGSLQEDDASRSALSLSGEGGSRSKPYRLTGSLLQHRTFST